MGLILSFSDAISGNPQMRNRDNEINIFFKVCISLLKYTNIENKVEGTMNIVHRAKINLKMN